MADARSPHTPGRLAAGVLTLALAGVAVVLAAPGGSADGLVPENLARGKPATASSTQRDDTKPGNAADGDFDTRWCADGPAPGAWWQVDLGKEEDLTGARLTWEFGKPYRYRVEGSADGKAWAVLSDQTRAEVMSV